jgi:hypothetical protein
VDTSRVPEHAAMTSVAASTAAAGILWVNIVELT